MKHETVIFPTLAGVTTTSNVTDPVSGKPLNGISADVNATEEDQVEVYTQPVLGAGETVGIFIPSASGGLVPAQNAAGTGTALLDATHQSVLLPGGMIYRFVKAATVALTSVEVYLKPRR